MKKRYEKKLLKSLIQKELDLFLAEKKTVTDNMPVEFIKGEALNEEFLRTLIEKLK